MDTSEGAAAIHVHHGSIDGVEVGHVYISGEQGIRFTKSLSNNVRSATGECDFDKAWGIDGIYVWNQIDATPSGLSESDEKAEELEEDANADSAKKRAGKHSGKQESRIRTLISFDKGGTWQLLKPPDYDSLGKLWSFVMWYVC